METAGLLLLLFAAFGAQAHTGVICPFPSPQCYKESTLNDEDFYCEWKDQDRSQSASYTLLIQSPSSDSSVCLASFDAGNRQYKQVPLESVLTSAQSDIWVQKKTENMTCISPNASVILNDLVKYSAPHFQKTERSAGNLTLGWARAKDEKGALYEIRWKAIDASWQTDSFATEDSKKVTSDSRTLHLENHLVYHVQVRRKATGYSLWSEWSRLVEFPVEIQVPVVRWTEEKSDQKGTMRTVLLSWDAPPPEASYGGVTYHLSLKLPCEIKNKSTTNTSYRMKVTVSEARVSITARNNVSESASREIIIPHVQHLKKACLEKSKTRPRRKKFCLEWYKLPDGKTRPIQVSTSRNATVESIRKDMQKFVRYYYYIHIKEKRHWQTQSMCPIYSTEGAPVAEPQNVTVVNVIHDSALLLWRPIPVQDQRGFLLSYMVWILREGGKTDHFEVQENATSFHLRNLTKGSSYTVYLAGRTQAGVGPNSTVNFLMTPSFVEHNSGKLLAKVLLSVGGVVLLLSVVFSIAFRRFKKKILPMIPSPVIPATASYHLPQNLRATTEEVHDVILLYREDLDKQNKAHVEQSTLLQDSQLSVCEEEDEEEEGDEEQFISSFPNPNYKGQMLRLPEPLAEEKDPKENNSEINTPSYRHVSVL